ncbi:MAG: Ig-like domain-containing protein, partial [Candidatus Poribacteria bacterium]
MKRIIIVLIVILLYVPLLSEGFSKTKPDLFEGQLYLSNAPLVGQKATLSFDIVPLLGDYGKTTVIFRVPDGVSILGQSTFYEPFLTKGALRSYSIQIEVIEKGTYALQASVYSQVSQTRYEVEHFFVYLIVKDGYSQIAGKVDSLTMSKKGIMVQPVLASPDLAMAQGVLSFSGYIKYYNDNLLRLVPIKNVAVQLYEIAQLRNILISTVYTDNEGFYSFDNIANPNMELRSFQLVIVFNNSIINLVNDKNETYKFDLPAIQNVTSGVFINDYVFNETNQFRCLGHIFNSVVEAGTLLLEKINWSRKRINTKWPYKEGNTSLYTYTYRVPMGDIVSETLNIAIGKEWDRTTMLHEYGHSIMSALYSYNYNNLPKGTYKDTVHYINTVSDAEFAMKEGWAEYCEALFDDSAFNLTQYANANTPNIEYNEWWKGKDLNNNKGEIVEGTVATILWDITDTAQSKDETPGIDDDEISFMLPEIWNTMSKKKPKTIIDFWNYWQDNSYGQIESLYKIFTDNKVSVTLKPQNRPPIANSQNITTNEDTAVDIILTGIDEDSDLLTFRITKQPSNGILSGQLPNQRYTPNPNFFGQDSFNFVVNDGKVDSQSATITIIVNSVNDPPVANSQSVTVDEDSQINITLTGSDPENDNLVYKIISQPLNGSLIGNPPNITYKPNTDFNGNDSFTFSINDGQFDSQPATVNIKVISVNDPPFVVDQSISVDEDSSVNITLTGADIDNDPLTFRIIKQPT